jgi:hypothetical protein
MARSGEFWLIHGILQPAQANYQRNANAACRANLGLKTIYQKNKEMEK